MTTSYEDNVFETTVTTGTGSYTPAGAVPGARTFLASYGATTVNNIPYVCRDTSNYEVGLGTWNGTTLARTVVLRSSNSNAAVNWGSGTRNLFVAISATLTPYFFKATDIASASTVNLASALGGLVHITGTTTITAFSSAVVGATVVVVFDGSLTITHNATSLILPNGLNIRTKTGDTLILVSEGSGNWRAVYTFPSYFKAADIASATTVDLTLAIGGLVHITGTTTITGFTTAPAGSIAHVIFDGVLTFTHNATSLILPPAANITTAAGDYALMISEGSGNWRCVTYQSRKVPYYRSDSDVYLVPTGCVFPFAGSSSPTGYLLCDGSNVSRTTYAALFAIIGTTYGAGDGSSTFALPDMRGRSVFGKDNMGGSAANRLTNAVSGGVAGTTLGATGGTQSETLSEAQIPAHSHNISIYNRSSPYASSASDQSAMASGGTLNTTLTGGGQAHNNVPPAIVLNYIIKT